MKDLLLQERGYLVLRVLADDVLQRLDRVIDALLRVLASHSSCVQSRNSFLRLPLPPLAFPSHTPATN